MNITSKFASWSPYILSILRIMTALLFVEHGTSKILGYPPTASSMGAPPLLSLGGFSGMLELVGGTLLAIGLFTRLVAFILSGEMAFAYFMVHAHMGFFPMVNKGEIAVLYCFVFLYLAAAGGGPWSIDHVRQRS
jgi:putative oxidoreductase